MGYIRRNDRKKLHRTGQFTQRQRNNLAAQVRYQRKLWSGINAALVLSAVYNTAAAMCRAQR